jgi:hypothetical protein
VLERETREEDKDRGTSRRRLSLESDAFRSFRFFELPT